MHVYMMGSMFVSQHLCGDHEQLYGVNSLLLSPLLEFLGLNSGL